MELILAFGIFGLVGSFLYIFLAPKPAGEQEIIQRRLGSIAAAPANVPTPVRVLTAQSETIWERITDFFLGEKALPARYDKSRQLLYRAGYPWERAVRVFWGVRIFLAGTLGMFAIVVAFLALTPLLKMILLVAAFAAVGYMLPQLSLKRKAKARTLAIRESLPDTLDLLVICVEAGLALDAALVRVSTEQVKQGLVIGEEFQLMTREIHAGMARREALSRLAERTDLDELRGLLTFLNQTEELGGSIGRSLRVYASTMRDKRSHKAEEAARKAVIKLIFPIGLFVLPAVFLVVFAPTLVNIFKLFATGVGR
ncbi:MAG TPA: type II secretion system F family protein [Candidatus Binatia bacterium]